MIIAVAICLALFAGPVDARSFTDSAGRTVDLRETTREFYALFDHLELSGAKLDTLIQWANGRTPQ